MHCTNRFEFSWPYLALLKNPVTQDRLFRDFWRLVLLTASLYFLLSSDKSWHQVVMWCNPHLDHWMCILYEYYIWIVVARTNVYNTVIFGRKTLRDTPHLEQLSPFHFNHILFLLSFRLGTPRVALYDAECIGFLSSKLRLILCSRNLILSWCRLHIESNLQSILQTLHCACLNHFIFLIYLPKYSWSICWHLLIILRNHMFWAWFASFVTYDLNCIHVSNSSSLRMTLFCARFSALFYKMATNLSSIPLIFCTHF